MVKDLHFLDVNNDLDVKANKSRHSALPLGEKKYNTIHRIRDLLVW